MRPSTNAVKLVVALAAGSGCAKATTVQTSPTGGGGDVSLTSSIEPFILAIDDRLEAGAVDPRAQALMQWVRPLEKRSQTACSSTHISEHALLTAAHCVDGDDPAIPAGAALATLPLNRRACGHGIDNSCARPFPTGEYDRFGEDVATVWLDSSVGLSTVPRLGRLSGYGAVPAAFMLSARSGKAHPVCNARATGNIGTADGWIERGDSGSSIVALHESGTPVILGIVSHRWEAGGRWYFAMIPNALPWPSAATTDAPPIDSYYDADFSPIQDCQ